MINSANNAFTSNTLVGGTKSIYLDAHSNNNYFISTYQASASTDGIYIYLSSGNVFNDGYVSGNTNGISLDYASGNTFSTTKVTNNSYGTLLSNAQGNSFALDNNANGIFLNYSNGNTITNTQIAGQNEIYIYSGANTIING